jgi:hypothetical protein
VTRFSSAAALPIHRSFLVWRNGIYAKAALLLTASCILLYALQHPTGPANGGTAVGYFLGTLAAILVLWLAWFGIRRRRYGGAGQLEGLLSAHVYFGIALMIVATLHAGFRLHWNVHSLTLVLLSLVVASGMFGSYAFWRYPQLMTQNRASATLTSMTAELATLDLRCRQLALLFPDDIMSLVHETVAPGTAHFGMADLVWGRRHNQVHRNNLAAIARVQTQLADRQAATPSEVLPLVQSLTQRLILMERMYRDWRYRALMLQWRAIHVPLTIGLIVALAIHVIVVFYDW